MKKFTGKTARFVRVAAIAFAGTALFFSAYDLFATGNAGGLIAAFLIGGGLVYAAFRVTEV